ncbi:MAG TPA: pilus assembly protein PilM, partial [Planctomycetota bacterium]|nr:pilus assembly protein PilM [Planctomycetota bacterium]
EQSGGDVAADWALLSLPAAAGEDDTVLVALARNAHLRPRLDAVKACGASPLGGCPRSIALYHAFVSNAQVPPGEVTLILHLGAENTDVAIQRDGALLFARNMAGGGKPFTDALAAAFRVDAETAERMKVQKGNVTPRQKARYADSTEEKVANTLLTVAGGVVAAVHSSLMFCKAQTKLQDLRVDRVLLCGAGARLRGLADYLASGLAVPVELFDPFDSVDLSAMPEDQAEGLREEGPAMAAALGLAQMAADPAAFRLEVLPEADRRKRDFLRHTAWLLASGVVAAAGLVFLYVRAADEERAARENEKEMKTALEKAASMREKGLQKRTKVEAAVDRAADLASQVDLGYAVERTLGVAQDALETNPDFEAIHFPDVKARFVQVLVPENLLPPPPADAPAPDPNAPPPDPLQARIPVVFLSGTVQERGKPLAAVYGNFVASLKAAVEAIPGARFDSEKGLKPGGKFEVQVRFFSGWRPVGR